MQWIPNRHTWRKSVLLYRMLRFRSGFGVHSPFVYHLITRVIREKCAYYAFEEIELVRRQFYYREQRFPWTVRHGRKYGEVLDKPVGEIVRREAIRPKQGALLFRLANYFQPDYILQIGASAGLATLYLTAYSQRSACVVLERIPTLAPIARQVWEKGARAAIDLRVGEYGALLPEALAGMPRLDFVFFNRAEESDDRDSLFDACVQKAHTGTVMVITGIRANPTMRAFWRAVCLRPEVTVTLDLYAMGIVLFNRKLHKRDYIVYF